MWKFIQFLGGNMLKIMQDIEGKVNRIDTYGKHYYNILMYINSINTWASGDSPLAQLVKELDLCLFLCVLRRL